MQENRRQRRLPISSEARLVRLGTGQGAEATLVDISNYGASLKTSVQLKANERVKLSVKIRMKDREVVSEEVPGTIRWVEHKMKQYLAGVSFDVKVSGASFPVFSECLDYVKTRR